MGDVIFIHLHIHSLLLQKENTIVYAGGQLKPSIDKEVPSKQKKWAVPGVALGNAIFMQDR